MSTDPFFCHVYMDGLLVRDSGDDHVSVYRENRNSDSVIISVSNFKSGFGYYSRLTPDKAEAMGLALVKAAKASRELVPVTEQMGPLQLMVAEALGPIKALFEVGAA